MRGSIIKSFSVFIFLAVSPLYSQEQEFYNKGWSFRLGGYYKNLFIYREKDEFYKEITSPPEQKKMISDLNRFRVSPEVNCNESFTFYSDIDIETVNSNYNKTVEFDNYWRESDYNDFIRLSRVLADNKNLYCRSEFQNIYVKMTAGSFTGTAGRQQVRFGSSRLWNPLDLMNPLSPVSVEGAAEQKGTDAVRLDWYPGESTEITGVVSPGREDDSFNNSGLRSGNYITRFQSGVKEFDAAALAGYTSKRKNFGADFSAEINDGLLTGVFLYSFPDNGGKYYQCGSGYEYTFAPGIYLLAEYFYNSLPVNRDNELLSAVYHYAAYGIDNTNCYILSNRIITYNSHYLSAAAGYDFFPLLRGELFSIYDFQGRGLFLNASLKLNAMKNLDLSAGAIISFVDRNEKVSDFVSYDQQPLFYASLQFFF